MQNSSVFSLLRERTGLQPDERVVRYCAAQTVGESITERGDRHDEVVHKLSVGEHDVGVSPGSMPTPTGGKVRRLARLHV
ncbi:hypothetical protein [Mycobacterium helveticum]|uniref:Uncharacterized protein n=1 Tax=Mycobacterium helveticum TaxID=2592811 RepID=A0A557Y0A8_9MYCO|nr:hypothetical protein [Mycobacterium helveticum]TVS88466.1 hypothetical protein FPZ46_04985 [Mycobacterium helveticum]TVS91925.1 hypothetical protein FPZ47_02420 [Mycobacterium helveticum]